MLRVDVHSYSDANKRELLIWFTWKSGWKFAKMHVPKKMQESEWIKLIEDKGVTAGGGPHGFAREYKLSEGKKFMEMVQYGFRGPFIWAEAPYKTKDGEYIKFPDRSNPNVKSIAVGQNFKKAEREKKRLQDDGFRVTIRGSENFPQEYTVVGVKIVK